MPEEIIKEGGDISVHGGYLAADPIPCQDDGYSLVWHLVAVAGRQEIYGELGAAARIGNLIVLGTVKDAHEMSDWWIGQALSCGDQYDTSQFATPVLSGVNRIPQPPNVLHNSFVFQYGVESQAYPPLWLSDTGQLAMAGAGLPEFTDK